MRPADTSITCVSLVGSGSLMGELIPPPQQYTLLKDCGLAGRESGKTIVNLHANERNIRYTCR